MKVHEENESYPQYALMLNLMNKKAVVVGGGQVAGRKIKQLLVCGAKVLVVSPVLTGDLEELAGEQRIEVRRKPYSTEDLQGACLIFAATDDPEVNQLVAEDAHQAGIFVNIAHASEGSDFTNPAVLRYGHVQINVSTGGASPTLTRHIVERVDDIIDERLEGLALHLHEARQRAQQDISAAKKRQQILRAYGNACWEAWEQKRPFPIWEEWYSNNE